MITICWNNDSAFSVSLVCFVFNRNFRVTLSGCEGVGEHIDEFDFEDELEDVRERVRERVP
jgi:hypothetical protein